MLLECVNIIVDLRLYYYIKALDFNKNKFIVASEVEHLLTIVEHKTHQPNLVDNDKKLLDKVYK